MPNQKTTPQHILSRLADLESRKKQFYDDGKRNWTIGVGYTPVVQGSGGTWVVRPGVKNHFKAAGIALTDSHMQAFRTLARERNKGAKADGEEIKKAVKALSDVRLSESQSEKVLNAIAPEYVDTAKRALGEDTYASLDPRRQAEFVVAAYQSPKALTKVSHLA